MNNKKILAVALAATMVMGSSMTVFAAGTPTPAPSPTPQTGTQTGVGTAFNHVDREKIEVTLPVTSNDTFKYWVDPERLVNDAGKLSETITVTGNDDGVYFMNAASGSGTATYSAKSDQVVITGKNSVAVDVSVNAKFVDGTAGKDIAVVSTESDFKSASAASLLMQLTVNGKSKYIPAIPQSGNNDGVTIKTRIAGSPENFTTAPTTGGQFTYTAKTDANVQWNTATIQLYGKTNKKNTSADQTAPKVTLTWTVTKSTELEAKGTWTDGTLWLSNDNGEAFGSSATIKFSTDGESYGNALAKGTNYAQDANGWVSITWNQVKSANGGNDPTTFYYKIEDNSKTYIYESR